MIKRNLLLQLRKHLPEKEMTILVGPRQTGKTYLMKLLQQELDSQGEKTLFLSLDIEDNASRFTSQTTLISYMRLQLGEKKAYVFIDEIQRKENAGLFLKGIYDMDLPYKFIISGSGSLELKAKIHESMAGRKQLFALDPIDFFEFVNFKTDYKYEDKLQDFFNIEEDRTHQLFEEYLMFGGYPKVLLSNTVDKKINIMEEIYKSYIEKDISYLLHIDKPDALTNLLKIIASQIGSPVNITELSSTIGIADKTVRQYLWYLEQTFIIQKVTPFHRNIRKEITKMPVYYFLDNGLRNFLLGLFGITATPFIYSGHLFENVVFNMLRQKLFYEPAQIHFWRTRDNAEVDFVIQSGLQIIPVEVKYTKIARVEISRSYRTFLTKYKPTRAYIIHLGKNLESEFEETKIYFIPFFNCKIIFQ